MDHRPRAHSELVLELVAVSFVVAVVVALCRRYQLPVSLNAGQGWDGHEYHRLAEQLRAGETPTGVAPFVYRLGLPMLAAAWKSRPLMEAFRALSLSASLAAIALFVVWLRQNLSDLRVRLILVVCFVTHPFGPLRMSFYNPPLTDGAALVILLLVLILGRQRSRWALLGAMVVAFAGAIVRDVAVVASATLLFAKNPIPYGSEVRAARTRSLLGPLVPWVRTFLSRIDLLAVLPAILAAYVYVQVTRTVHVVGYSDTLLVFRSLFWGKSVPALFLGWCLAFGPLLSFALFHHRDARRHVWVNQQQLAFLGAFALVGWFMGTDTERLTLLAAPVVLVVIGRSLETHRWLDRAPLYVAFVLALQTVALRWYWPIPDHVGAEPPKTPGPWYTSTAVRVTDLTSFHGDARRLDLQAVEHAVVMLGLLVVLWLLASRERAREAT